MTAMLLHPTCFSKYVQKIYTHSESLKSIFNPLIQPKATYWVLYFSQYDTSHKHNTPEKNYHFQKSFNVIYTPLGWSWLGSLDREQIAMSWSGTYLDCEYCNQDFFKEKIERERR